MNCRVADLLNGYTHVTVNIAISGKSNLCINQAMHRTLFCHCHQVVKCFKILPKKPFIYLKQHGECNFTIVPKMLKSVHKQFRHVELCVKKLFGVMKVVKNGKSNLCIPQTTNKTLFCYCLLVG